MSAVAPFSYVPFVPFGGCFDLVLLLARSYSVMACASAMSALRKTQAPSKADRVFANSHAAHARCRERTRAESVDDNQQSSTCSGPTCIHHRDSIQLPRECKKCDQLILMRETLVFERRDYSCEVILDSH